MPRPSASRVPRAVLVVATVATLLAAPAAAAAYPSVALTGAPAAQGVLAASRSYPATIALGRTLAAQALKDSGASSVSIALTDGTRVLWHQAFGAVDAAGTKPAEQTMYGLGSVSKTLVAVAVMRLVDAGKVFLDSPVVDYVTDFSMASPEYRRITVRMLLDHTAGLPGSDYANAMTTAPYDGYEDQLLRGLRTERLKTTPGAMSVYCNDCYTLAQIAIERVTGRTYEDYVTDEVLTPLGMTHTKWPTAAFPAGSYAPTVVEGVVQGQEYLNLPGSGSAYSTPVDMSHLAMMLMNGGVYRGTRILTAASVAEMGRDQIGTTLDPVQANEYRYGLGWDTVPEPGLAAAGVFAWAKGGDANVYHAGFTVAPKAKLAATVQFAGTSASSTSAQTLGQTLILRALVERGDLRAMPQVLGPVRLPARKPTATQLAAITGMYLAGGSAFRITSRPDGSLIFGRFLEGEWADGPASFTLRSDGRFWDTKTGSKAFSTVTGWGRHYLVLRQSAGYGHYRTDMILGERLAPGAPLSAAWKARLGKAWVFVTEVSTSLGWASPGMRLREIPGLPGYLYADVPGNPVPVDPSTSDSLGAMTVVIPAMQGRDLNDVDVVKVGGREWLRMGSTLRRPLDGAPTATKGDTTVTIADGALAEWVGLPATGKVTTSGAAAWSTFDADLVPVASGPGDASALAPGDARYLVVFAAAGKKVIVTVE